ncbi:MAG: hypothetical protein K0Q73_6588, partial [Paenibacillus sp.]|nr:hypothetical protein [Paenibacillus sp.]
AFLFKDQEDAEASQIQADLRKLGVAQTITKYTTIAEDHLIHEMIKTQYEHLQQSDLS